MTSGVAFELDRIEMAGEDRLEVNGRWFGVRGRRFIRPSLTLVADEEHRRLLADLDHKPWAADDAGGGGPDAAPACVRVKVWPAIVNVPMRELVAVAAAAV